MKKKKRKKKKNKFGRKCVHGHTGPNKDCICFELRAYGADE